MPCHRHHYHTVNNPRLLPASDIDLGTQQKARESVRQETMRKVISKLRKQFDSEDDELSLEEIEVALYELDQSELDQPNK